MTSNRYTREQENDHKLMQDTTSPQTARTPRIDIYESAMCCNTGVCGSEPDATLITFTADCAAITDTGISITRHNLARDPENFVANLQVRNALDTTGSEALPIVQVDGQTVLTGTYPTRDQLLRMAGITKNSTFPVIDVTPGQSGCCGGATGCC
ncbi:MAG: arsenite efflux transporter metallochaperone ArsD [Bifidobacterium crudilactis]